MISVAALCSSRRVARLGRSGVRGTPGRYSAHRRGLPRRRSPTRVPSSPATGCHMINAQNMTDTTPARISSHSPVISLRSFTPIQIIKIPVAIAYAASNKTITAAAAAGARRPIAPATTPRMPSSNHSHQLFARPRARMRADDCEHAIDQNRCGEEQCQNQQRLHRPHKSQNAKHDQRDSADQECPPTLLK